MDKIVIACETLRDELTGAVNKTGCHLQIIWVDSVYHSDPEKLREKLQKEIDSVKNADNILLAFGNCGNAVAGLRATAANLIIPKTDDCISMLLSRQGKKFKRAERTYFLTRGWIESPRSLDVEFERNLEKYGRKRTEKIFKLMLGSYKYLMLIDTGAYDADKYKDRVEKIAGITNLDLITESGSIWFLEKLLTGPYDDNFFMIPKGGEVKTINLLN